jgi:hypothetical protein
MNELKPKLYVIAVGIFQFAAVTFLILTAAELVKEGFVTYFFDITFVLWILIASGIASLLLYTKEPLLQPQTRKHYEFQDCFLIALVTGSIVYFTLESLGTLRIILTVGYVLVVLLFSFYLIYVQE